MTDDDFPLHQAGEVRKRIEAGEPVDGMLSMERAHLKWVVASYVDGMDDDTELLYGDDPTSTVSAEDLRNIVRYIAAAEGE